MPDHQDIPARDNACWKDPVWRSSTLFELAGKHGLTSREIATMTGAAHNTARLWLGDHRDVIPANTLRALLLDLRAS